MLANVMMVHSTMLRRTPARNVTLHALAAVVLVIKNALNALIPSCRLLMGMDACNHALRVNTRRARTTSA